MRRRDFLIHAGLATMAGSLGTGIVRPRSALGAECLQADLKRTVVNLMLQGGADFRFLFMPAPNHPDPRYLDAIWNARRGLYDSDYPNYAAMFENEYLLTNDPLTGQSFGIARTAGWLHSEFESGRVAVVANAVCSQNRRHDQSILNADAGVPDLDVLNFDRDGWGGRLVEAIGDVDNAVELGSSVSVFSKGSTPGERLAQVVHAQDMRNMALAGPDPQAPAGSRRNALARALNAWYEGATDELLDEQSADWVYRPFLEHRASLKAFGEKIDARLADCGELPEILSNLTLNNADFAQQCRNLYDTCQLPDVLSQRVLSMSYGGWDTHDNQYNEITSNLEDLFGAEGGLATVSPLIGELPWQDTPANEQLVFSVASDFGRQLVANGTGGTDHGSGTYSLVFGAPVRGGVYGEMFPQREARTGVDGQLPLATGGADIMGLTSTERVQASLCNWCEPGSGNSVFPAVQTSVIETPGLLDNLLRG